MCGRFTITLEAGEIQLQLGLGKMPANWQPRFNIAPSQMIPVVTDANSRDVEWMKWGLVPFWAKTPEIGNKLINARAETANEKPAFRQSFKKRRCLILADGFYEWLKSDKRGVSSIPYYFHQKNGQAFAFSGLWDQWTDPDGNVLDSCTILTCPPNSVVKPVHNRMPVILDGNKAWDWLSLDGEEQLQSLLKPVHDEFLTAYPVSRIVNDPHHDSSLCVQPDGEQKRLF